MLNSLIYSVPVNNNPNEDLETLRNSAASNYNLQPDETSETHPYDKVKSNHGYSKIKKKGISITFPSDDLQ